MKLRITGLLAITAFVACLLSNAQSLAQKAYITNQGSNNVSVIDTTTNTVTATIPVGNSPFGVATTPDGSRVYIANSGDNTVSVIDTATNAVSGTIPHVGGAVAVTPDGSKLYTEFDDPTLSFPAVAVIDTATNIVTTIPVTPFPFEGGGDAVAVSSDSQRVYFVFHGQLLVIDTATNTVISNLGGLFDSDVAVTPELAVTPDGSKLYVTSSRCGGGGGCPISVIDTATNTLIADLLFGCFFSDNLCYMPKAVAATPDGRKVYTAVFCGIDCSPDVVLVIDTATNTVTATIPVRGSKPEGVAVTPDGSKVYVANNGSDTVSVIDTATNAVIATIPVGSSPVAFGIFIPIPVTQPAPATGRLCNGIYDGTFNGNLTVSAGQDCIFLNGRITGNVTVVGGNFALNGATVGGNVTVIGGGTYRLGPAATVGGNLIIRKIPPGSADNSVCGTTVDGNVQLNNDGTGVQIGSTAPLFCAGNTIGGSFEVVDNSSSALMFDNSVGGNMSVLDNTGPVDVVSNAVRGNLLCQDNTDLVIGSGNTASRKTGQCH
jgi:YVTN family beta-propeller protein